MILFPAIDILGGRAVRLLRGEKAKVTDYGDPVDRAMSWVDQGATFLHVVDLDGAFDETGINLKTVEKIVTKTGVSVQTGGGIRTKEDVARRLDVGVTRVIIGTAAVENPALVLDAPSAWNGKMVLGLDAKNGFVSTRGWEEVTCITPAELAKQFESRIDTVVYTDVMRDGALCGVNVESTVSLQKATGLQVIASGGVSQISDLVALAQRGVYGAILGKAIYNGNFTVKDALKAVGEIKC